MPAMRHGAAMVGHGNCRLADQRAIGEDPKRAKRRLLDKLGCGGFIFRIGEIARARLRARIWLVALTTGDQFPSVRVIRLFMLGILAPIKVPAGAAIGHHADRPVIWTKHRRQPIGGRAGGDTAIGPAVRQHARNHGQNLVL